MIVTVLTVLLWILAGIAAFLLFALCTPLRISGSVVGLDVSESEGVDADKLNWRFRISWVVGLVAVSGSQCAGAAPRIKLRLFGIPMRISVSGGGRKNRDAADKKGHRGRRGDADGKPRNRKGRSGISWTDVRSLLPELRWFMGKMRHTLKLKAKGDLEYGFEDPATTAMCEGLKTVLPLPRELILTPDFGEARLAGWVDIQLTIYPMRSGWVMMRAVFRRGVRRVWWAKLRQKLPWAHSSQNAI